MTPTVEQYSEDCREVLKAVYRRLSLDRFDADLIDQTENLGLIYRDGEEFFCSPVGDELLESILGSDKIPRRTVAIQSELAKYVFKKRSVQ